MIGRISVPRPPGKHHGVAVLACLALLTALSGPLSGQEVRGTVRSAESGEPVAAALVELLNEQGHAVSAVLSDDRGHFRVTAPAVGRYRVSVERIGLTTVRSRPMDLRRGAVIVRHLALAHEPIALDAISVQGTARCVSWGESSGDVQRLWEEARKMLRAVSLLEDAWYASFRIARWERDLEPSGGTVLRERTERSRVVQVHPFESRAAPEVIRDGFVREAADTTVYLGPDAEVLLSDEFLAAYCFRAVSAGSDSVGLAFRPLDRSGAVIGIEGVLWMSRQEAALRRIEFEYPRVPSPSPRLRSGGSVVFDQLENGAWVISSWHLRMPRYAIIDGRPTRRIAFMHESGGEVLDATVGLGSNPIDRSHGTLSGRLDWGGGKPMEGALVYLSGTSRADTTEADGTFRIPSVRPGRYALSWIHPDDPAAERATVMRFAMPSHDTTLHLTAAESPRPLEEICPPEVRSRSTGIVLGTARSANGMPLPRVPVRLTDRSGRLAETHTDAAGRFHFCDAISGSTIGVTTEQGTAAQYVVLRAGRTARLSLQLQDESFTGPDIVVAEGVARGHERETDRSLGRVVGVVLDGVEGRPVQGAEVVLADRVSVLTDSRGRFLVPRLPASAHSIRVRHVGFDPFQDTIHVGPGELVALELRLGPLTLDPITVTARRRGLLAEVYWRAERGVGGIFLTADEVRARNPTRVTDALRDQPGIRLTTSGTGRSGQVSFRGCAPTVYLDGARITYAADRSSAGAMAEAYGALNLVHPSSIEMVEVYRGPSEVPAQFGGSTGMCGAIALWTRRGVSGGQPDT